MVYNASMYLKTLKNLLIFYTLQTLSLAEYDGVISVGGDGMFAEVNFIEI